MADITCNEIHKSCEGGAPRDEIEKGFPCYEYQKEGIVKVKLCNKCHPEIPGHKLARKAKGYYILKPDQISEWFETFPPPKEHFPLPKDAQLNKEELHEIDPKELYQWVAERTYATTNIPKDLRRIGVDTIRFDGTLVKISKNSISVKMIKKFQNSLRKFLDEEDLRGMIVTRSHSYAAKKCTEEWMKLLNFTDLTLAPKLPNWITGRGSRGRTLSILDKCTGCPHELNPELGNASRTLFLCWINEIEQENREISNELKKLTEEDKELEKKFRNSDIFKSYRST